MAKNSGNGKRGIGSHIDIYNNLRKVYLGLDNEGQHWEVVFGGQLYVFK